LAQVVPELRPPLNGLGRRTVEPELEWLVGEGHARARDGGCAFHIGKTYTIVNVSKVLGARLKAARAAKELPLQAISETAKISTAYLHKLEAGRVNSPNPRVLQRLAEVLDVSYRELMELTGYLMPVAEGGEEATGDPPQVAATGEPRSRTGSPTNDALMRQLEAIRLELAGARDRHDELARELERLPGRVIGLLEREEGPPPA